MRTLHGGYVQISKESVEGFIDALQAMLVDNENASFKQPETEPVSQARPEPADNPFTLSIFPTFERIIAQQERAVADTIDATRITTILEVLDLFDRHVMTGTDGRLSYLDAFVLQQKAANQTGQTGHADGELGLSHADKLALVQLIHQSQPAPLSERDKVALVQILHQPPLLVAPAFGDNLGVLFRVGVTMRSFVDVHKAYKQ